MALYKRMDHLSQSNSSAFDTKYAPCAKTENAGIYCCCACGEEIIVLRSQTMPGASHHVHAEGVPKMEWQLVVLAQQKK